MSTLFSIGGPGEGGVRSSGGESHLWLSTGRGLAFPHNQRARDFTFRAVIDLGLKAGNAARRAAEFQPHVLVLTHGDNDHIGGVSRFFGEYGGKVKEVWVPYEWGVLASAGLVLQQGGGFRGGGADRDVDQLRDMISNEPVGEGLSLPGVRRVSHNQRRELGNELEQNADYRWIGELENFACDETIRREMAHSIEVEQSENPQSPWRSEHANEVAQHLGDRVDAIMAAMKSAVSSGSRLRFFSTDSVSAHDRPWLESGRPGFLTVVNAVEVEVAPIWRPTTILAFAMMTRITVQNSRALMSFLWDDYRYAGGYYDCDRYSCVANEDFENLTVNCSGSYCRGQIAKPWGVLICSDSDATSARVGSGLQNSLIPWAHTSAMTAPHHGSAATAHDAIWDERRQAQREYGRTIPVLLAGGSYANSVTRRFTDDISADSRSCTMCRHSKEEAATAKSIALGVAGPFTQFSENCL